MYPFRSGNAYRLYGCEIWPFFGVRPREPLDYFLTRRGVGSWSAVRLLIHREQVTVNGRTCKRYRQPLEPSDHICVAGRAIVDAPDVGTLICNKFAGLACSHAPHHAPLLYDSVPMAFRHPNLQTVGRLDRDTTGLLLLTIDGIWAQSIVAPNKRCWKRYRLAYSGSLIADAIERVADGLLLDDEPTPCRPAHLRLTGVRADGLQTATLALREGRHHQVKRMIAQVGGQVVHLHRDRIGGLCLPATLRPGEIRPLNDAERQALCDGAGADPVTWSD